MRSRPPRVTRYGAWLLGRYLEYSTEKARARLGWQPSVGYRESIERTLRWFQEQRAGSCFRSAAVAITDKRRA